MKRKIITLSILSLFFTLSAKADFVMPDNLESASDAFFIPSSTYSSDYLTPAKPREKGGTIPPIKKLRLNIQNWQYENSLKNTELAPTPKEESIYSVETSTSEYVSKEETEDFEDMTPDGFEADEETVEERGRKKLFAGKKEKKAELEDEQNNIILDCDNVDYDTPNYLIKATGNVSIEFVKQKTTVKADIITFDRINNTIKAEGNVRILKSGKVITGDYIFVDLNEENALIENPLCTSDSIEIKAKKGYVYGDKITQEDGFINVKDSYPIVLHQNKRAPQLYRMLTRKDETLTEDIENGIVKFRADSIKIKQKGDLEVISIKKGRVSKGKRFDFKIPAVKVYTNKNHDYAETNYWEIGNYRGLGLFTGPGWVFELPKGSVLKTIPFINAKNGAGVGLMGRFHSGTNTTTAAYGTAAGRFFVYGKQELDDDLFLQYSVNSYMDEWFLGRRRPKYGISLVYNKDYASNNFLIPNKLSAFKHRFDVGYFHDSDFDSGYEDIYSSGKMGTTRFRYMAHAEQNLFEYKNPEKLKAFSLGIMSQLSAAVYGTGDTQIIGKLGPHASMQYKRWMQDIAYLFVEYDDHSPMPRYDAYRYGSQYLALREYFRICKWLTVSWYGAINTTNDTVNGKRLGENIFYFSFGPDDFKVHIGYDFVRQTLRTYVDIMMDAKGANIEYNKFEITQDKKAPKDNKPVDKKANANLAPTQPKVLQKAVVEDIKVMDDVL